MIDAVVFDLDGTIWRSYELAAGAAKTVAALTAAGVSVAFVSNASVKSEEFLALQLRRGGVHASARDVYTSAAVGADYLHRTTSGLPILVHGQGGAVLRRFQACGLDALSLADHTTIAPDRTVAICIAYSRTFGYRAVETLLTLRDRTYALYALERDRTFSSAQSLRPGSAWAVAASEAILGQEAIILGKPNPEVLRTVARTLDVDVSRMLLVGDSLTSDVAAALNAGALSCLLGAGDSESSVTPHFTISCLPQVLDILAM